MFLLDVGVKGRVTQIGLRAVSTFKVAALDVILRAALSLVSAVIVPTVVIAVISIFSAIVAWLLLAHVHHIRHSLALVVAANRAAHHHWIAWGQLHVVLLTRVHQVLAIVHVSHLHELARPVAIGPVAWLLVVHAARGAPHQTLVIRTISHHHGLLAHVWGLVLAGCAHLRLARELLLVATLHVGCVSILVVA